MSQTHLGYQGESLEDQVDLLLSKLELDRIHHFGLQFLKVVSLLELLLVLEQVGSPLVSKDSVYLLLQKVTPHPFKGLIGVAQILLVDRGHFIVSRSLQSLLLAQLSLQNAVVPDY